MNCSFDLLDTFLPNSTEGGSWELVGYSTAPNGPFNVGGNWPWGNNSIDHIVVDFADIIQGYYKLTYYQIGECEGSFDIIVPVVGGGDAGITTSINLCMTDGPINIYDLLGSQYDTGIFQADFDFSGSGVTSGGYVSGDSNSPADDTFDPSLVALGSYEIVLQITPEEVSNQYPLAVCDQCVQTTATLLIEIIDSNVEIGITNCEIDFVEVIGCPMGAYELYKDEGGGFVATGITSLPYSVMVDADWEIRYSSCDCNDSPLISNTVTSVDCCEHALVIEETSPCVLDIVSGACVVTGDIQWHWHRSTDGGINFVSWSQSIITSELVVNDDACYRLEIDNCDDACFAQSNKLCVNCSGDPCPTIVDTTQIDCELIVESLPCAGGVTRFQKLISAVWTTQQSYTGTNYPHTFNVTSNGTYRVIVECAGCPDIIGPEYVYSTCDPCISTLSMGLNNCILTATVTNCPSPTYIFRRNGAVVQTGPSNVYTVLDDGDYSVEVTGCPNCGTLLGPTIPVMGCTPVCDSVVTLTVDGCDLTAVVTNCPSPTYKFKRFAVTVQEGPDNTYTTTTNGTYSVEVTGCPNCGVLTDSVVVDNCVSPCAVSMSIAVDNCTITVTPIGTCPSPIYTFKKDGNVLQTGASNVYEHADDCSGCLIFIELTGCPNCPLIVTSTLINCLHCDCSTSISEVACELISSDSNCDGYDAEWRYYNAQLGAWETKGTGANIFPDENGTWQRKLTKDGCPDIIEEYIVDCLPPVCELVITQHEVDPLNCDRVLFAYEGAIGSNVVLTFQTPFVNANDCPSASAWFPISPYGAWSINPDGTGGGYYEVTQSQDEKCHRLLVQDFDQPQNGLNCPIVSSKVFVPSCCDINYSVDINGVNTICEEQALLLLSVVSNGTPPLTYEWRDPNGLVIGTTQNITVNDPITGIYELTVWDDYGCIESATHDVVVTAKPNATINITDQPLYCTDETIEINVVGFPVGATFHWTFSGGGVTNFIGQGTPSIEVVWNTIGNKTINLDITIDGCTFTYNQPINIDDCCGDCGVSIVNSDPENWCEGSGDVTLTSQLTGCTGVVTYEWRNPNNVLVGTSQNLTFTPNTGDFIEGLYTVRITEDGVNCTSSASINVGFYFDPNIGFIVAGEPCINQWYNINIYNVPVGATVNWLVPGGTQQSPNPPNVQVKYTTIGFKTITAEVTDVGGCVWTEDIVIEVNNCCLYSESITRNCVDPKVDYVFLIDTSASIDGTEWTNLKASIDLTIDELETNNHSKQYSILQYASDGVSNNLQVTVNATSDPVVAKNFSRAVLGDYDHLNPTIQLLIDEIGVGLTLRADAKRRLVIFTDALVSVGTEPGAGSTSIPYTNMNTLKLDHFFDVSCAWFKSGTNDLDKSTFAAIPSLGGPYVAAVDPNVGDPQGSEATPRRLYWDDVFDGLTITGLTDDLDGCRLEVIGAHPDATYEWDNGETGKYIIVPNADGLTYCCETTFPDGCTHQFICFTNN